MANTSILTRVNITLVMRLETRLVTLTSRGFANKFREFFIYDFYLLPHYSKLKCTIAVSRGLEYRWSWRIIDLDMLGCSRTRWLRRRRSWCC